MSIDLHEAAVLVRPTAAPGVDGTEVEWTWDDGRITWSVTNASGSAIEVESVALAARLGPVGNTPRMFVNGWQSWSPTGMRRIGVDRDPSGGLDLETLRGVFHADATATDVLRSELVTVIDPDSGAPRTMIGFEGATEHDGTIRVERDGDELRVIVEAYLGGVRLAAGERRVLHPVRVRDGDDPTRLLVDWARTIGAAQHARTDLPYTVGWCSWYQYFHEVTEAALRENLARASDWPFDVFQLDDGFQAAIGDWLDTDDTFPSDLASIADAIRATGATPGIWLAPFLAHGDSEVGRAHPDWFARDPHVDHPLIGGVNDHWGGFVQVLDTTRAEVLDHLASVAAGLVDAGFEYLKLDFTYAPALPGRFADPSRTPAQRVRAAYEAVRSGAGADTVLLGCGAPLGPCIGLVDAMRIGPDVAPHWLPQPDALGHADAAPSTRNAWHSTAARSFMHRTLWANDPDCVMLRTTGTDLPADLVGAWARTVGASGGLAIVSDDLGALGPDERALLDEVTTLGRAADAAALDGAVPDVDDPPPDTPP